jgi:hypothetical protein
MGLCGPLNIPQDCSLCLIKPHVLKGINKSILLLRKRSLLNFGCGICHTVILLYFVFFIVLLLYYFIAFYLNGDSNYLSTYLLTCYSLHVYVFIEFHSLFYLISQ